MGESTGPEAWEYAVIRQKTKDKRQKNKDKRQKNKDKRV